MASQSREAECRVWLSEKRDLVEGLLSISAVVPRAIITEIAMPEMDGYAPCRPDDLVIAIRAVGGAGYEPR